MVTGHNIAHCTHCGKDWIVGDCIPFMCDECYQSGHDDKTLGGMDCPECAKKYTPEFIAAYKKAIGKEREGR